MTEVLFHPATQQVQQAKYQPAISAQQCDLRSQILCTPQQAMRALGIGNTLLYELLANGSLRSIKIGKARRIIVQSLADYVSDMESYNFGELKGRE